MPAIRQLPGAGEPDDPTSDDVDVRRHGTSLRVGSCILYLPRSGQRRPGSRSTSPSRKDADGLWPLRPGLRARRLRGRHGGRSSGSAESRHRRPRPDGSRTAGPSRGVGRRGEHRRRGRNPRSDPAPFPVRRGDGRGYGSARPGRLRRRAGLPSRGPRRRSQGARRRGTDRRRGRSARPVVAGGAHRDDEPRHDRPGSDAPDRAAVRGAGRCGRAGRRTGSTPSALDRRAFVLRKRAEHAVEGLYFPSLSARTIVYKGMLTSEQLREFFPDLRDPAFESGLALVHSRFSTNTFPSWPLAHPYRYLCHNGEINTLAGNRNWMRAREALLDTDLIDGDLSRVYPVCTPGASDSASFDEVLELLHLGGRSAAPRRPDDDPRGVGEPRHDGQGPASLLPVPRIADGALGRAGGGVLHRRDRRGCGPRPQWPAPGALLGHRRRAGGPGQRGRCPRHRTGADRAQGPPAARPDVPGRHGPGASRRGRGDQGGSGGGAPLRASGWPGTRSVSTSSRPAPCSRPSTGALWPNSGSSATRTRSCASSSLRWRAPGRSPSDPWVRTRRSRCCPIARGCSTTTSPSCSHR